LIAEAQKTSEACSFGGSSWKRFVGVGVSGGVAQDVEILEAALKAMEQLKLEVPAETTCELSGIR
jgi:Fe-S cluster assembly ATPase SufC